MSADPTRGAVLVINTHELETAGRGLDVRQGKGTRGVDRSVRNARLLLVIREVRVHNVERLQEASISGFESVEALVLRASASRTFL